MCDSLSRLTYLGLWDRLQIMKRFKDKGRMERKNFFNKIKFNKYFFKLNLISIISISLN